MISRIRQGKYKYIIDKWYCCNKYGLWKQNKIDLYLDILDITAHYNVYMFLIEYVSAFKRLGGYGFCIEIINIMTNLLYDGKIDFDTNPFL